MPEFGPKLSVCSRLLFHDKECLMDFLNKWLARFRLSSENWRTESLPYLADLPFSDQNEALTLLGFLFEEIPEILRRHPDCATRQLADAFGWCCFSFWQCGSAFPAFPEDYAHCLKAALQDRETENKTARALAKILAGSTSDDGQCGYNKLTLKNPAEIREAEKRVHQGAYELYLKSEEKYDEYATHLSQRSDFQADWLIFKKTFPEYCQDHRKILHRTTVPERNWVRGAGATFEDPEHCFQATFDLFCWKYFLWGMEEDTPLLMKPTVTFTPFGTQIFIPGYLSIDLKRDFNITRIVNLHKARGIQRQGKCFSFGRTEKVDLRKKAKAADAQARKMGLKGDDRYQHICKALRQHDSGDYRFIKKLLEKAS